MTRAIVRRSSCWLGGLLLVLAAALPVRADLPEVKVAVLKFGTVNWLMETVRSRGLDREAGYRLETLPLGGGGATAVAFQAGEADMLVTDWIWAMRQRTDGKDLRFLPYSTTLGALIGRDVTDLCALRGKTVGVVGGPLDKSWLVFQALAEKRCGMDLAAETETLSGAPPLMSRQLEDGAADAVSTYWHFVARLEAKGMTPIVRVDEALAALGIAPAPPLIGFVWDPARVDPALAARFERSIRAAGAVLAADDAAWDSVRPLMRARTDAEFEALRAAYRTGIPAPWTPADTQASARLYDLLAERAGAAFTERAGPFDAAVFPGQP